MPIFEYECSECGKVTEVLVKSSGAGRVGCEHCGSKKTKKKFSTFSAQAKESAPTPKPGCMSCPNNTCPHAGGM